MKVSTAFDTYQRVVNAPKEQMIEARRRRDLFRDAFASETDKVSPSGSLARGTQHDPIKDVDTILVFDQDDFPASPASPASPRRMPWTTSTTESGRCSAPTGPSRRARSRSSSPATTR